MLTNKHGLPAPLVNAIRNDPYSRGMSDISVTQLIQPPQIRALSKGLDADEDASEFIWRLLGQAVHTILERAYPETAIVEKRVFAKVRDWIVSGQFDVYENEVLTDYKITSVYARDGKIEWENQLNLLRALCHRNEMPVSKVQIVAIFRDWRPKEALADDYPKAQVAVIPVSLWPIERAEEYLEERVRLHQLDEPPPCTDEERWMSPPKWALMQKGRKRAVKLFDAKPFQMVLSEGQYWELRPGVYRRCESYCRVSSVCPQWKAYEAERANENGAPESEALADVAGRVETSAVGG